MPPTLRHTRRLSDKVLIAFHHACDIGDLIAAAELLQTVESILNRTPSDPSADRRRNKESLVAAYERLWELRHPESRQL